MARNDRRPRRKKSGKRTLTDAQRLQESLKRERAKRRELDQALKHEQAARSEALEQQTATSEILRVISSLPTQVQPVFDTIVRNAVVLCEALFGAVFRFDGDLIHLVAHHNLTPEVLELLSNLYPMRPSREQATGRAILSGALIHIHAPSPTQSIVARSPPAAPGGACWPCRCPVKVPQSA